MKTTWALALALHAFEANAESKPLGEVVQLGFSRIFVNDALGDGRDRWQTGSYVMSIVKGPKDSLLQDKDPGRVWEFRLSASIISPSIVNEQGSSDRSYATALGIGARNHFDIGFYDGFVGIDLYATGPQTQLDQFHAHVHELFGMQRPRGIETQIGNDLHPTLIGEIGRSFELGRNATLRPFFEGQVGIESLARVGIDVTLSSSQSNSLWLRERVTGQRYLGARTESESWLAVTLGVDTARIMDSVFFEPGGATMEKTRHRVRAGIFWTNEQTNIGIGLSMLSPEFKEQAEGQVVGFFQMQVRF